MLCEQASRSHYRLITGYLPVRERICFPIHNLWSMRRWVLASYEAMTNICPTSLRDKMFSTREFQQCRSKSTHRGAAQKRQRAYATCGETWWLLVAGAGLLPAKMHVALTMMVSY